MTRRWFLFVLAVMVAGCSGKATGMRIEQAPVYAPPAGTATVVFVRHTGFGGPVNFVVVDENRRFVSALRGSSHSIAAVPPGQYTFYVIAENTDMIRADLAPDRIYVVEARVRMGVWKAQVTAEAVRRGTPRFSEALAWVGETPATVPSVGGQQWVDEHAEDVAERIAETRPRWDENDPVWRSQHTLAPDDGYHPDEFRLPRE